MIAVQIRYEGNEAIMILPPEVIEKLSLDEDNKLHLEITHEGLKAYPSKTLTSRYLIPSNKFDEERKDLDMIAILSSN